MYKSLMFHEQCQERNDSGKFVFPRYATSDDLFTHPGASATTPLPRSRNRRRPKFSEANKRVSGSGNIGV
jgi:hypothetical protein